jgi:predicted nucleic acid-binding protein
VIVVDSSAVVDVLAARTPDPGLAARLSAERLHAPYLVDVEVMHAVRGLVRRGALSADRGVDACRDYSALRLIRYPHLPLLDRIWQLRDSLSAYDAAFVALAELLDAPLVTCDAKLAAAGGHEARVELYGR